MKYNDFSRLAYLIQKYIFQNRRSLLRIYLLIQKRHTSNGEKLYNIVIYVCEYYYSCCLHCSPCALSTINDHAITHLLIYDIKVTYKKRAYKQTANFGKNHSASIEVKTKPWTDFLCVYDFLVLLLISFSIFHIALQHWTQTNRQCLSRIETSATDSMCFIGLSKVTTMILRY